MSLLLTHVRMQDEKVLKLLGREVYNRNKTHSLGCFRHSITSSRKEERTGHLLLRASNGSVEAVGPPSTSVS